MEDFEILRQIKDDLHSFSNLIGNKTLKGSLWESYRDGDAVPGSVSNFGDFVVGGGLPDGFVEFVELWPEWLGLLLGILTQSHDEDPADILVRPFSDSILKKKIKMTRQKVNKNRILEHIISDRWKGYMLVNLKSAMNEFQQWNWGADPLFRGLYLNTASIRLLQRRASQQ